MRYKNIKTGTIIDSPSNIIGDAWELVDDNGVLYNQKGEVISGDEEVITTDEEYVEEEIDLEAMTKAELIDFAKEQDVEVNEKDTKAVIIEDIAKAFE